MTTSHWILVANAAHARLLELRPGDGLVQLGSYEHPASRRHARELAPAQAGRERRDGSFGAASFEARLDAHRKEHLRFAAELAEMLEQAARGGRCTAVTLVASSPFLGELKQMLGSATGRMLAGTQEVDLTRVGLAELPARLGLAAEPGGVSGP